MSARINVGKAGLVLGAVIGGWHLCWSALVALHWAQPVARFCVLDALHQTHLRDRTV